MIIGMEQTGEQKIPTPVSDMMKYVHRYKLEETVRDCARQETPNWKRVQTCKCAVKRIILEHDELRWKASTLKPRFKTLRYSANPLITRASLSPKKSAHSKLHPRKNRVKIGAFIRKLQPNQLIMKF